MGMIHLPEGLKWAAPTETPYETFRRHLLRDIEFTVGLRRRVFLWIPRKLTSGKWAWLRHVEKAYDLTLTREECRARHWKPVPIYEECQ